MAIDWKVIHVVFLTKKEADEAAAKKRALGYKTKVVKGYWGKEIGYRYSVHYGK
jgi:hypothetical protein